MYAAILDTALAHDQVILPPTLQRLALQCKADAELLLQ